MAEPMGLSELGMALIAGKVVSDEAVCAGYALRGEKAPQGVIRIKDVDMLTATIKWARAQKKALVPSSSSGPHFHASLKTPDNAWVLDLSGMKRIININRRNRVAMFEAGVTFEELVPLAKRNNLRVMLPLSPRLGKSALAAYLDREPVIYPKYQWDISDPLLCLEVVYGTGDIFRTGSAAGPGTIEEQWAAGEHQKSPMGPGQNDWMKIIQGAQGGIGVATWCSCKCEVRPEVEKIFVAGSDNLEQLTEASYRMFFRKLTDIHFILDKNAFVNLLAHKTEDKEQVAKGASDWNMVYSVSGIEHYPEERAEYLASACEKELGSLSVKTASPSERGIMDEKAMLKLLTMPNQLTAEEKNKIVFGIMPEPNWKDRPMGAHRSVFFQTTLDKASRFVHLFDNLAKEASIESGHITRYIQPQLGGRCCHIEFIVSADPDNENSLLKTHEFCQGVARPLINEGAFFSRPHGDWAEPAMKKASSSFWIYEKVKNIFDPDHVLVPGRLMTGGAGYDRA